MSLGRKNGFMWRQQQQKSTATHCTGKRNQLRSDGYRMIIEFDTDCTHEEHSCALLLQLPLSRNWYPGKHKDASFPPQLPCAPSFYSERSSAVSSLYTRMCDTGAALPYSTRHEHSMIPLVQLRATRLLRNGSLRPPFQTRYRISCRCLWVPYAWQLYCTVRDIALQTAVWYVWHCILYSFYCVTMYQAVSLVFSLYQVSLLIEVRMSTDTGCAGRRRVKRTAWCAEHTHYRYLVWDYLPLAIEFPFNFHLKSRNWYHCISDQSGISPSIFSTYRQHLRRV